MAKKKNDQKKRRLFIEDDSTTLSCMTYCGGPGTDDAHQGAANILRSIVNWIMDGESDQVTVTLTAVDMTDAEIADLPDVG